MIDNHGGQAQENMPSGLIPTLRSTSFKLTLTSSNIDNNYCSRISARCNHNSLWTDQYEERPA